MNVKWMRCLSGVCIAGAMAILSSGVWADYSEHPDVKVLIEELVSEQEFDREELQQWFAQAEKKQSILDAMSRPAEKTKEWKDYRGIFVTTSGIKKGVNFWRENKDALTRAESEFGVPAEVIVAIIGVETRYGRIMGNFRVIDALSTLAFDYPRRAAFFRKELKHYFVLTRQQQQDPLQLKGSYAGAMGYGQFMPSSFLSYAVDFDGDNKADIWNNPTDAIGSVANYFKQHGWQTGEPVVSRARIAEGYEAELLNNTSRPSVTVEQWQAKGFTPVLDVASDKKAMALKLEGKKGAEFWLGFQNFYVFTRYNRSRLYAMAAYDLSQGIKTEMDAK